jgi:hypothetical protein
MLRSLPRRSPAAPLIASVRSIARTSGTESGASSGVCISAENSTRPTSAGPMSRNWDGSTASSMIGVDPVSPMADSLILRIDVNTASLSAKLVQAPASWRCTDN